ncbi:MAG TPA: hypothetical protein VNW04_14235, partial [Puia sp.]|nr:hypothetical protein [Puia sp.]
MEPILPMEAPPGSSDWTDPEKWVWQKVCSGEKADFNQKLGAPLDPSSTAGWTADRLISGAFLQSILLAAAYRSTPSHRGIRIAGAWIKDPIDLSKGKLIAELWLDDSRFEEKVNCSRVQAIDLISFERSFFAGDLLLYRMQSTDALNLSAAVIKGQLSLYSASIDKDLYLTNRLTCTSLDLRNARIGRTITLHAARIAESLQMDGIWIGRDLFMDDRAECGHIRMVAAEIEGQLE